MNLGAYDRLLLFSGVLLYFISESYFNFVLGNNDSNKSSCLKYFINYALQFLKNNFEYSG